MTREELWLLNEKWHGEKTDGFLTDCERLKRGEPLAYIIGYVPFLSANIHLDSQPLIPRPETEFWTEQLLDEIKKRDDTQLHILDLCAGSGCIGIGILKATTELHVDFAEYEAKHHATIQKNVVENGISSERTQIIGGNLFEEITGTYDYILSNPPYIDPILDRTTPSVKTFEPHIALYGGTDGMDYIASIITAAPRFLKSEGILVIEHEPEQVAIIHRRAQESNFSASTQKDQYGVDRFTYLTRKV